jgi:hypothetical protein
MSLWVTWQVMNFFQAVTMPTVAGETVKPDGFRVPKICDIPARFSLWQIFCAAPGARFCRKIGIFGVPALPARRGLINGQFTTPGSRPPCGPLLREYGRVSENTGAGLGRRDGLNLVPTRNRAGWNAMKRGIGF